MGRRWWVVVKGQGMIPARKDSIMGNLTLNLDEVSEKQGTFEALPKGTYDAIVDDVEFGDSSKGSPMLTWKFKVDHEEYGKRTFFFYTVLDQEFGKAALKRTLIALDLEVNMADFDPAEFADDGEAIGLPCQLKLGIQKYEGEKRNNVREVLAASESDGFI